MKPDYSNRIKQFRKKMDLDLACFISEKSNTNLYYFTGFKGFGVLLIFKKSPPIFIVSRLDSCKVQNKKLKLLVLGNGEKLSEIIKKNVKKKLIIGLDYPSLSIKNYNFFKKVINFSKSKDISNLLSNLRERKDNYEIEQIERACDISCDILKKCIKKIPFFSDESEIKQFIELEAKKKGFEMSFETIVASEKNGAKIHYELCNDKLKKGFLVIDFGIKINEYCSDMTRTFYLGVPSSKEIEMYEKVRTVQDESIEKFKLNLTPFEIDTYVRQILGKEYIHSLGHGVGLDIHENPGISILNKEKIVENAVFTIEPGVYFENKYGIRIEDTVVKQKNTIKALTLFTKELIIIDCNKKIIDKKNV